MTTLSPPAPTKRQPSIFWRRFRRSTPGKVGAVIVAVLVPLYDLTNAIG